jgi:hypothetical protein
VLILSLCVFSAVAADISGKWVSERPGRDGAVMTTTFTFKVSGSALTGTVGTQRGDTEITEGKVSGDELSFVVVRTFNEMTMKTLYKGKAAGGEIRLTQEMQAPPGGFGGGGGGGGAGMGGGRGGPVELVLKKAP